MAKPDIIHKTQRTISRYAMIRRGEQLIAAVSGGADSVCLLDLLSRLSRPLGFGVVIAHFDHGLRPAEDESETRFVTSLSQHYGFLMETGRWQVLGSRGGSLEARARKARYAFLEGVREKHSAHKVATGHNLNDQAETVIMRLLRGSGPLGLGGIPPVRSGRIIRPLIELSRKEIEGYLQERGLKWVSDSSNLERHHLRNQIRWDLMPQLEQYQPRIVETLARTADRLRSEGNWLMETADQWLREGAEEMRAHRIILPLAHFLALHEALQRAVIRQAVARLKGGSLSRLGATHVAAVRAIAVSRSPQAQSHLPSEIRVRKSYDQLVFTSGTDRRPAPFHYVLDGPGIYPLEAQGTTIELVETTPQEDAHPSGGPEIACLDAGKLGYPLILRSPEKGDRFVPLGMTGRKKLKDLFIDLKIPKEARAKMAVLTYRGQVVWVCGLRIDDRFKIGPETKQVLTVTLRKS